MHQQPPKTPLFASTSPANASQFDSSRALIVYPTPAPTQTNPPALRALGWASVPEGRLSACRASADLLGQPDENALGASDVAEPIHVFVLNHLVDELRAVPAEPGERIVEVVHGEHDTQVAQSVHRGVPVIGDHRRRENR